MAHPSAFVGHFAHLFCRSSISSQDDFAVLYPQLPVSILDSMVVFSSKPVLHSWLLSCSLFVLLQVIWSVRRHTQSAALIAWTKLQNETNTSDNSSWAASFVPSRAPYFANLDNLTKLMLAQLQHLQRNNMKEVNHTTTTATTPWPWIKAVNDITVTAPWESEDELPIELLPWLYLSDIGFVKNIWSGGGGRGKKNMKKSPTLVELGITHVISTNEMKPSDLKSIRRKLGSVGIQHFYVDGRDIEGYNMIPNHWNECRQFLENQVRKNPQAKEGTTLPKVLVHCRQGQNRSALIACAAMMVLEQRPLLDVVTNIKAKRGLVLTNLSFQRQLCMLAFEEGLIGNRPDGYTDDPAEQLEVPKR